MESRPNVIGIIGLAAVVASLVLDVSDVARALLWVLGLVAGIIGLFRAGRIWGVLALFVGLLPVWASFIWFVANFEQLAADGYLQGAPFHIEATAESESESEGEVQEIGLAQTAPSAKPAKVVEPERQWIEIKSPRGGYVKVYIGMPSEEVKALIGKPKAVRADGFAGRLRETWRYDLPGYSSMTMEFSNGELSSFNQY